MDRLVPTIQHYDWGDLRFIPELQGRPGSDRPEAELWMGAHAIAPSVLESNAQSLPEAITADPEALLGSFAATRFGELPFLVKVLAAARPLSIQAHPSQSQAAEGFARENAAGIAVDGDKRTYRDPNPKPELVCALSTFEAKCGFRPRESTRELFDCLIDPDLDELRERLRGAGSDGSVLAHLLAWLLRGDSAQKARLVAAVVESATNVAAGSPWHRELEWTAEIDGTYTGDIGVVVALLLNHVILEPGQALFLGAGTLHSYLRGGAIEVMGNSDNVIRGGLTSKHVDIEELLSVIECTPEPPLIQSSTGPLHTFSSPVAEFSLTRAVVDHDIHWTTSGPEILIVTEGVVEVTAPDGRVISAESGVSIWVPAVDASYRVSGNGVVFRTTVGSH